MKNAYELLKLVHQRFPVPSGGGGHSLLLSKEPQHAMVLAIRIGTAFQMISIDADDLEKDASIMAVEIFKLIESKTKV